MKDWMYNEFSHVGVDYSSKDNASEYDIEMVSFRDYDKEVKTFLKKLKISDPENLTVIDLGCGTGAFSIHAAKYFKKVHAVDVSKEMIKIATEKADYNNIKNIQFHNSGFLQFRPEAEVDLINTKWAFHHLPDYWKQAALLNINKMLKPDGAFFMSDVVFKFDSNFEENMDAKIKLLSEDFSENFISEVKIHIKEEYSTFDWILQGMIERAGFNIEQMNTEDILESEYICRKVLSF